MLYSPVIPMPPRFDGHRGQCWQLFRKLFLFAMLTCCGVARLSFIKVPNRQYQQLRFGDFSDHFCQFFLLQLKTANRSFKLHSFFAYRNAVS